MASVRGLELLEYLKRAMTDPLVAKSVGETLARDVKSAWLSVKDILGHTMETDLKETGKLIKKVAYHPAKTYVRSWGTKSYGAWVGPASTRRKDVSKRAGSSMGLLAIHMMARPKLDPLGTKLPGLLTRELVKRTQEEVNILIRKGKLSEAVLLRKGRL